MTHNTDKPMSLRKNVLWNTFGSVFYQGCIWLMTVLVVRLSSDYQNSGMLAFAMSVGNIYTAIGTYTMRTYQVSDVTGRYNASNYVALRIVTVLGGLVACGIYSLAISPSSNTMLVIGVFLLFKADEAFANVLYGCDQVAMRLDYVGISQVSRGVICVSFFALGLVATNNLVVALLSVFLGCILVTAFYDIPRTRALVDSLHPSISKRQCLDLLKECFPTVAGNVLGGLVVSTARQYFGIAYGEAALGIYASEKTRLPSLTVMGICAPQESPRSSFLLLSWAWRLESPRSSPFLRNRCCRSSMGAQSSPMSTCYHPHCSS